MINIMEYGAVGDGRFVNTPAISCAIRNVTISGVICMAENAIGVSSTSGVIRDVTLDNVRTGKWTILQ